MLTAFVEPMQNITAQILMPAPLNHILHGTYIFMEQRPEGKTVVAYKNIPADVNGLRWNTSTLHGFHKV